MTNHTRPLAHRTKQLDGKVDAQKNREKIYFNNDYQRDLLQLEHLKDINNIEKIDA
jgi:hypothetical protein